MLTIKSFTRRFIVPLWGWYAAGFVMLAITNLITLQIPQLSKEIVNTLEQGGELSSMEQVALAIIGLGLAQLIVRSLSRILVFWPGRKMEATAKTYLFNRVMRLPMEFFMQHGTGDLISRLANDMTHVRVFFAFGMLQLLNLIFLFGFVITKMLETHTLLTIYCLSPLVLMLVATRFIMKPLERFSKENQAAVGTLTTRVTEAFVNIHSIQCAVAETAFQELARNENQKVFISNIKTVATRTLFFPLISLVTGLAQVIVVYYGGGEVVAGRLSIGDILAFNIYLAYLAFPLSAIGIILAIYQRMKTAMTRLDTFVSADEESGGEISGRPDKPLLEVRGLDYSFSGKKVLNKVSFTLRPGEKLGVFGPVGSGKSTMMNLISRLYRPEPGMIFWKGQDITQIAPAALRKELGYGLQSVHLFSRSVSDNIAFGMEPPPSEEQTRRAARLACVDQDIEGFSQKWQTQIGEKGVRLSGGQKQRLALARLFIRSYECLLLDDVLSAVDQKTERDLVAEIHRTGASAVIASHRPSVLQACDRVIILHEGSVFAEGTYRELAKAHPGVFEGRGFHAIG